MFAKFVKPRFCINAAEVKKLAEDFVIGYSFDSLMQIATTKLVDRGIVAVPREKRTFQNIIKPLMKLSHDGQKACILI